MSGIDLNSFTLAGMQPVSQVEEPGGFEAPPEASRPAIAEYKVQPATWMFITLALAIVGLWFFLED